MKKFINILVFAGLFLALPACGLLDRTKDTSTRSFTDQEEAQNFFNSSTITCEGTDCPSYIGGLYTYTTEWNSHYVTGCTVTLISENTVLTNRHCVPDNIATAGSSCKDRIRIVLPANNSHVVEHYDCETVQEISKEYPEVGGPDWAILKFSGASKRTSAILDSSGVPENQAVVLYPIYFDLNASGNSRGEARRVDCKANTNMIFSDSHAGPQSALLNIAECTRDIVSGNSGTGIVSTASGLVGIHASGFDEVAIKALQREYPYLVDNFGSGTNLHCITPISGVKDEECAYDRSGTKYEGIAYLNGIGRALQKSTSYDLVGAEAEAIANESNDIQFAKATPSLMENFEINTSYDDFLKAKAVTKKIWMEFLFPVLPICMGRQAALSTDTIEIPMRMPLRNGDEVKGPLYNVTRRSFQNNETFKVVVKEDHVVVYPKSSLLYDRTMRSLLSIDSWKDLKLKVEFCQ